VLGTDGAHACRKTPVAAALGFFGEPIFHIVSAVENPTDVLRFPVLSYFMAPEASTALIACLRQRAACPP
jgi:hypothetical protein